MKGLGADAPYWRALSDRRLELPQCVACGKWHWPAPFRCAECGSWEFSWQSVEMSGRVYSWTRTWHAFDGAEALGLPYVTASIELPQAGNIRLFGLLEPGDAAAIGLEVKGTVGVSHIFGRDIPAIRWSPAP